MANISKSGRFALVGIGLGGTALLVHNLSSPSAIEGWYGNGLFWVIRSIQDYTFGILPISGTLALVLVLAYLLMRAITQWRQIRWKSLALKFVGAIGLLLFSFYLLWGFNYSRASVLQRVNWTEERMTSDQLFAFGRQHLDLLNELRTSLDSSLTFDPHNYVQDIRSEAYLLAKDFGYRVPGKRLRLREWSDIGFLLRIGTAGFYNPFTGECNIDGGLHNLQKPYVIAHEFFHGLGVTDEGDCNFLAYVLCTRAKDEHVRYCGELAFWRYLRSALHQTNSEKFAELAAHSSPLIDSDLASIRRQMLKYPDIAPRTRDRIYNAYLQSNKIDDGMASYGNVVGMVIMWRKNGKKIL